MPPVPVKDFDLCVIGESFVEFTTDNDIAFSDAFRKDSFFVVDPDVSYNTSFGEGIAGRVLRVGDMALLTRAALLVDVPVYVAIVEALVQAGFSPVQGPSELPPEDRARYSALVIRACLEEGQAPGLLYEPAAFDEDFEDDEDFDDDEPQGEGAIPFPGPIKKTTNIGRNDPCPCGSGKKYKKCCGKG